jgi:hypothetical protein
MVRRLLVCAGLVATLPFTMGAKGCAASSTEPAPAVAGHWNVTYADTMEIDVTIGGSVYHKSLPGGGGTFVIDHGGKPFMFDIDCSRPDVVCPSEVWPATVAIDQRDPTFPHRMWVAIPVQKCSGNLVAPKAAECGKGTLNPDCDPVCDGTMTTTTADAFGVINNEGNAFDLLLGAGVASNGLNCALLGLSVAHADLVSTGSSATKDWTAEAMQNGTVKTGYAGGCLWIGDPNMDGTLQALAIGASVVITTPFSAARGR